MYWVTKAVPAETRSVRAEKKTALLSRGYRKCPVVVADVAWAEVCEIGLLNVIYIGGEKLRLGRPLSSDSLQAAGPQVLH